MLKPAKCLDSLGREINPDYYLDSVNRSPWLVSFYENGISLGSLPKKLPDHWNWSRGGFGKGWTSAVFRNCQKNFLMIDESSFGKKMINATLTLGRDVSVNEFVRIRSRFFRKLYAANARFCWVCEFTRAGRPHLHLAIADIKRGKRVKRGRKVYGGGGVSATQVRRWWARACFADRVNTSEKAQRVKWYPTNSRWLQYMVKHLSRGNLNYQRQKGYERSGWKDAPQLWGVRNLKLIRPQKFILSYERWVELRRLVRKYVVAQLKASRPGRWDVDDKGVSLYARWLRSYNRFKALCSKGNRTCDDDWLRGFTLWLPRSFVASALAYIFLGDFASCDPRPDGYQ